MTRLEFTGVRRDGSRITLETSPADPRRRGPSAIGLLLDVTAAPRRGQARRRAAARAGLRASAEEQAPLAARAARAARGNSCTCSRNEVRQPLNNASGRVAEPRCIGLPPRTARG